MAAQILKQFVEQRLAALSRNPFEAARIGNLERSFVNDILNGKKTSVRGANLEKLAIALDCELADLVGKPSGEAEVKPLIYREELDDNDCIQVVVGDLRKVALRALRRGGVEAEQALALTHVLVATLATHASAAIVVRLKAQGRNAPGSREQETGDQS